MVHQQLTRVKPHIREGHAVKGYEAKRFKGVEDEGVGSHERVSKNAFQDEHSKIENELFDSNGNMNKGVTLNQMEGATKKLLCLSDECGVDPVIFSQKNFLQTVYDQQGGIINENVPTASATPHSALKAILDKENLQTIIQSVDSLEKIFSKELGEKTERIDPFTFKFKTKQKVGMRNEELYNAMNRYVEARMGKMSSQFDDVFSGVDMRRSSIDTVESIDEYISNPNFNKSIGASIILSNIRSPNQNNELPRESWDAFQDFVDAKGIFNLGFEHYDPDKLQNILTKELRNSENFEGRDQISKFFKTIDTGSVVPAFNYLMNNAALPNFLLGRPQLMKEIKKTVDGIKQIYDVEKTSGSEIYVSRNPLNILTMSPELHAPSCQSLMQDGKLNITNMNINVPASYLTFATNDFLMYTLNKEGQKNGRMSMSFDPSSRKFVNYENDSIYGSSAMKRAVLGEYVSKNDMFKQKNADFMYLEDFLKDMNSFIVLDKLSKALTEHDRWFQDHIENDNIEEAENDYGEFQKSHRLQKENSENIARGFTDEMDEMFLDLLSKEKSMNYNSSAMSFVSGSKAVGDEFDNKFRILNGLYKDMDVTMKYDLDQARKKHY